MISDAVRSAELAVDKQAQTLLMSVSDRRQLNELPDDLWMKLSIEFYRTRPTLYSRCWEHEMMRRHQYADQQRRWTANWT